MFWTRSLWDFLVGLLGWGEGAGEGETDLGSEIDPDG